MAYLDHEVPDEAKNITLELLQRCTGHYCVAKYALEDAATGELSDTKKISVGLICALCITSPTDDKGTFRASVTILQGLEAVPIESVQLEYLYAVDLLPPPEPNPEFVANLLGLKPEEVQ